MIIVRAPLRITLNGGGTDLPSYYREHGGFLIAATIDKYIYITVNRTFGQGLIVKYSKTERVHDIGEIQHPIFREALSLFGLKSPNLEITSLADIPAGTGLGSSGSFTVGLLQALHVWHKNYVSTEQLAEQACDLQLNKLKEPIGKQDQYASAFGGVTCYSFHPDGRVEISPLKMREEILHDLEDNLLLFYTGITRSASNILKDQDDKCKTNNKDMFENLHYVKELAVASRRYLEEGKLSDYANLMDVHWQHKRKRSASMSNEKIDHWYDLAMKNGALGGKLIGAGGGGFLMFYSEDKSRLRRVLTKEGLAEVRFRFDFEGTRLIAQN